MNRAKALPTFCELAEPFVLSDFRDGLDPGKPGFLRVSIAPLVVLPFGDLAVAVLDGQAYVILRL